MVCVLACGVVPRRNKILLLAGFLVLLVAVSVDLVEGAEKLPRITAKQLRQAQLFKNCMAPVLVSSIWPPASLYTNYSFMAYNQIVTPNDGMNYLFARQTYNSRYQRYPTAIFYAQTIPGAVTLFFRFFFLPYISIIFLLFIIIINIIII